MFLGYYELNGKENFDIYFYNNYGENGYKLWFEETFSPSVENAKILDFKISGKNYQERKASLQDLAIDYSNNFASLSWSYNELMEICNWFYEKGKKYGLLREFKENGIC